MRLACLILCLILSVGRPVLAASTQLLVFGDSLASGFGLPPEQGFPAQLQRWLHDHGREVTVVNAGVAGDTTTGGLRRLGKALTPGIDAAIVILGGNDLIRQTPAATIRANLDAILGKFEARGVPVLLAGMPPPVHHGSAYRKAVKSIYPDLALAHGALLYPDFLAPVARNRNLFQIMFLFQSDGLHPNAKGVGLIVDDIGPYVLRLLDGVT